MVQVGKSSMTGGGGQLGVSLVLQGSYTCAPRFWIRVLVSIVHDEEDGGKIHVGLLCQIKGRRTRGKSDGSWETPTAKGVLWATGMKSLAMYIGRWQEKVAQWLSLLPLV